METKRVRRTLLLSPKVRSEPSCFLSSLGNGKVHKAAADGAWVIARLTQISGKE